MNTRASHVEIRVSMLSKNPNEFQELFPHARYTILSSALQFSYRNKIFLMREIYPIRSSLNSAVPAINSFSGLSSELKVREPI